MEDLIQIGAWPELELARFRKQQRQLDATCVNDFQSGDGVYMGAWQEYELSKNMVPRQRQQPSAPRRAPSRPRRQGDKPLRRTCAQPAQASSCSRESRPPRKPAVPRPRSCGGPRRGNSGIPVQRRPDVCVGTPQRVPVSNDMSTREVFDMEGELWLEERNDHGDPQPYPDQALPHRMLDGHTRLVEYEDSLAAASSSSSRLAASLRLARDEEHGFRPEPDLIPAYGEGRSSHNQQLFRLQAERQPSRNEGHGFHNHQGFRLDERHACRNQQGSRLQAAFRLSRGDEAHAFPHQQGPLYIGPWQEFMLAKLIQHHQLDQRGPLRQNYPSQVVKQEYADQDGAEPFERLSSSGSLASAPGALSQPVHSSLQQRFHRGERMVRERERQDCAGVAFPRPRSAPRQRVNSCDNATRGPGQRKIGPSLQEKRLAHISHMRRLYAQPCSSLPSGAAPEFFEAQFPDVAHNDFDADNSDGEHLHSQATPFSPGLETVVSPHSQSMGSTGEMLIAWCNDLPSHMSSPHALSPNGNLYDPHLYTRDDSFDSGGDAEL